MQLLETFVSEDQSVVDIPNVTDEQVVVSQGLFEIHGLNLFTDGNYHQTQCCEQRASHTTAASLADASVPQSERLHVQSRLDERRYIFDHNLSGDVETSERATFYEVTRN